MTGNQPLDDFGRAFREEANAFMFDLLVRANTCLRDVTLPAMALVAQEGVSKATSDRLQEMEDRLGQLQVNHDFEIGDLGEKLREYRDIDREFHGVYGCTLKDWSRENKVERRVLTPREVNPTRRIRDYVVEGVSATGGIPSSQDLRLRDNSNLGMSPSIRGLDQAMGQLGQVPARRLPRTVNVLTPGRHFGPVSTSSTTPDRQIQPTRLSSTPLAYLVALCPSITLTRRVEEVPGCDPAQSTVTSVTTEETMDFA